MGIQVFENLSTATLSNTGNTSSSEEDDFRISPPTPGSMQFIGHDYEDLQLPNYNGKPSPLPSPLPLPSSSSMLLPSTQNDDPEQEELVNILASQDDEVSDGF